ncbi:MAG: ATP-dependent RNA helicase, partial [Bacteriovoracaceae bacterium]|nr:ATP-dependent RNA helicase [Bacteriovoracaceae bacterium]
MDKLAIDAYQAQIKALKGNFILQASPGSGKSTRVPVMLHTAHGQKVMVLEPRRMAAKFAALRVAAEQGWEVGQEVGYVFRWEKMAGPETKITYFTEGSFVRYLLAHPDLPGVGTVLLDEFHERHLETDLALAMLRNIARPIQLGLMSATLDLGESQSLRDISQSVLNIEAPSYPLQLHYLAQEDQGKNLVARVVNALLEAWEQEGDILVFLPGLAEIRQVATAIEKDEDFKAATLILHGERSLAEQQAVLAPRKERKIILATNIAESSLTIPGIKIVIDSGLERTVAYHALSQTSRLTTQNISQASAIQRAARGNRQGAGQCWRLYTEDEFQSWPSHALPEIQRSDLTSAYLLAAAWPNKLVWPIEPPVLAQQSAQQILCRLNALDEQNHLTSLGKELSKWPLHPRQALMMLHACLAQEEVAQEVINFIARGMSLKSDVAKFDPRLQQRLQQRWKKDKDRIKQNSSQIFGTSAASFLSDASRWTLEQIVFWAYFDHLALWRPKTHNFTHAQGITLVPAKNILDELAHQHEWWCVLDLDGQGKVSSMIPVEKDWAYLLPCSPLVEKEELVFAEAKNKVMQHSEVWLDHLVLERQAFAPRPDQQKDVTNLLLKHAKRMINDWFSSEQGHRGQYILKTLNASPSMANDAW